jgi:hypothetical protein
MPNYAGVLEKRGEVDGVQEFPILVLRRGGLLAELERVMTRGA